ncbi:FecR domain-containing protein [Pseudomonas bharatica]|uniref:FecR domain-containing protein n=1 Tax=Pseudomonas TaxID=286 RepID=UPI003B27C5DA
MNPDIDPLILGEAADWLVQLQSGAPTDADHRAIQLWCKRSPQHALAWQRAEALLGDLHALPGSLASDTFRRLHHSKRVGRRQALHRLGLFLLAGPALWMAYRELPWQQWSADQRTAIGEQKSVVLPDGTQLLINTGSAVNIAFNAHERRIKLLEGELLISTAKDPTRSLVLETRHGTARALGTRFSVRIEGQQSHVFVTEGAVEMHPAQASGALILNAGEQGSFGRETLSPAQPLDTAALSWEHGMLLARTMRLDDLLAELGRYRRGVLRCHGDVAALTVSGAFPVKDTDASLRLLQDTLPIRINSLTHYWVAIEPR